jgi:hypothetical protein
LGKLLTKQQESKLLLQRLQRKTKTLGSMFHFTATQSTTTTTTTTTTITQTTAKLWYTRNQIKAKQSKANKL